MHLGQLLEQVLALFDSLSVFTMQAGLEQAIRLHERVVEFRNTLGEEFITFTNTSCKLSIDDDDPELQHILIRFTVYGIYLQVKMLTLLPLLQMATWQAVKKEPLPQTEQREHLITECVQSAFSMVGQTPE
jgi:hypothetical protein